MYPHDSNEINRLIGRFADLQEQWEGNPVDFDWHLLEKLARDGASAYNEGAGPGFHALVIDGTQHDEFHERFLASSIDAGFDPFKLSDDGSGKPEFPVLDHAALARQAASNPYSRRMHQSLQALAQARFEPLVSHAKGSPERIAELYPVFQACAESIPIELLAAVAPELAKAHPRDEEAPPGLPDEGYLSAPESIIDSGRPYG